MIIHLISGPRNISTALMYSFAQREDMSVVDEPFYAHYLEYTGVEHPGREDTLKEQSSNAGVVKQKVIFGEYPTPHVFLKDMAHHLIGMDLEFLSQISNVFLVRDPERLITSFAKVIPEPTMRDIGLAREWELFRMIREDTGETPVVLDTHEVLKDPEGTLHQLCKRLDLPFDPAMLSWEAGPRPEDGSWAKYWYKSVHQSSHFAPAPENTDPFPEHCRPLLEEAIPFYNNLVEYSIQA